MSKTLTRSDIAETVHSEIGLPRRESGEIIDQILEEMTEKLVGGEAVKISSFGRFFSTHKKQRIGRNPRTGEEVSIKSRSVLLFHASRLLKSKINGG